MGVAVEWPADQPQAEYFFYGRQTAGAVVRWRQIL